MSITVAINYEVFIFYIAKKLTILNKMELYNDDIIKINFELTIELYIILGEIWQKAFLSV